MQHSKSGDELPAVCACQPRQGRIYCITQTFLSVEAWYCSRQSWSGEGMSSPSWAAPTLCVYVFVFVCVCVYVWRSLPSSQKSGSLWGVIYNKVVVLMFFFFFLVALQTRLPPLAYHSVFCEQSGYQIRCHPLQNTQNHNVATRNWWIPVVQ